MAIRPMPTRPDPPGLARFKPPLSQARASAPMQDAPPADPEYDEDFMDEEIEDFVDFPGAHGATQHHFEGGSAVDQQYQAYEEGAYEQSLPHYGFEPFSEPQDEAPELLQTRPQTTQAGHPRARQSQAGPSRPTPIRPTPLTPTRAPQPQRVGQRRHVSELPDVYRGFFSFPLFNQVQSVCFDAIYHSPCNAVITAPTGTGKTVIFELAIIRLLEQDSAAKVVYLAPTKSLCSERYGDWSERFRPLGVRCVELTGDTGTMGLRDVKEANVIVTTPEKWDGLTRRWHDYSRTLGTLRLLCLDEVHLLREERGSVLEVVVSRMKTLGTNIRLVALSATVPNIEDVGTWLGDGGHPDPQGSTSIGGAGSAAVFKFGEEYRPVKLSKHVYGYKRHKDQGEFAWLSMLNYKLMGLIKQHSSGKPTLIFCGTRKGTQQAADTIAKAYKRAVEEGAAPWPRPTGHISFVDKALNELAAIGIGFHHGGVDVMDRKQIESLFISGSLRVLCTTSTLSVGVNLPARCVILRGTQLYAGQKWESYTDLDFMQMMGRAGRPQFDTEGVAVIMCEMDEKARLEKLVRSETVLESCLHLNLTEHINAEISLGTLTNVEGVLAWLRNSFLYIRIQKNPKYYALPDAQSGANTSPDKQLEEYARAALDSLAKDGMLARSGAEELEPTDLGDIMSKFLIKYTTFLKLLDLKPRASLRNLLEVIADADEFASMRIRPGEAAKYNAVNQNPDIRFQLAGKVTTTAHKVMLLIQAAMSGISMNELKVDNTNPQMEFHIVWQSLPRICKCAVDLAIAKRDAAAKHALELSRSVEAKAWEAGPAACSMLRQLDNIGEKSFKLLADRQILTIDDVRRCEHSRIENILNRNPPFGRNIVAQAQSFPNFDVQLEALSEEVTEDGVLIEVQIRVSIATEPTPLTRVKNRPLYASVLVITNDMQWIEFRRIKSELLLEPKEFVVSCILVKPSQKLQIYAASEYFAGVGCIKNWSPSAARELYPKPRFSDPDKSEENMALDVLEGLQEGDLDLSADEYCTEDRCLEEPAATNASAGLSLTYKPTLRELQKGEAAAKPTSPQTKKRVRVVEEDDSDSAPDSDRLPNGRYRCAHKCKSCKHDCCINGMDKPSHALRMKKLQKLANSASRGGAATKLSQDRSMASSSPAKSALAVVLASTGHITKKPVKTADDVSKIKFPFSVAVEDEDLPDLSTIMTKHQPSNEARDSREAENGADQNVMSILKTMRQPQIRLAPLAKRRDLKGNTLSGSASERHPEAQKGANALARFQSSVKSVEPFEESKAFAQQKVEEVRGDLSKASAVLFRPADSDDDMEVASARLHQPQANVAIHETGEEEIDELEDDEGLVIGSASGGDEEDALFDYAGYVDAPATASAPSPTSQLIASVKPADPAPAKARLAGASAAGGACDALARSARLTGVGRRDDEVDGEGHSTEQVVVDHADDDLMTWCASLLQE